MTRERARDKGTRYLSEGRLIVTHVDGNDIRATCRGDGATYDLGHDRRGWWCSCMAATRCAHLYALGAVVALITPKPTTPERKPRP